MSLFDSLGGSKAPQQITPQQAMQQLRANPAAVLKQAGMNIPAGMNDPRQIVNHLVQSGQLPQNRLTQIMQMMGRR